jgi:hypothetical protein
MKTLLRNLRWDLADWLCRMANRLRGHDSMPLGWDIFGNRAAHLEDRIRIELVGGLNVKLDSEEFADVMRDLGELSKMARATWWHDPRREP